MTTPNDQVQHDLAARADRAVNNATEYTRTLNEHEVVDDRPALAGVGNGYSEPVDSDDALDDLAEREVDLSDMPKIRSLQHELPSARFTMLARATSIVGKLPKSMIDEAARGDNGDDIDFDKLRDMPKFAEAIVELEQYVLDMAYDTDDMRAWLIQRGDIASLMGAFNVIVEHVKN